MAQHATFWDLRVGELGIRSQLLPRCRLELEEEIVRTSGSMRELALMLTDFLPCRQ